MYTAVKSSVALKFYPAKWNLLILWQGMEAGDLEVILSSLIEVTFTA